MPYEREGAAIAARNSNVKTAKRNPEEGAANVAYHPSGGEARANDARIVNEHSLLISARLGRRREYRTNARAMKHENLKRRSAAIVSFT